MNRVPANFPWELILFGQPLLDPRESPPRTIGKETPFQERGEELVRGLHGLLHQVDSFQQASALVRFLLFFDSFGQAEGLELEGVAFKVNSNFSAPAPT